MQRRGRYPELATLTDQAMTASCSCGRGAGCKGAAEARRDNNVVDRHKKTDAPDPERVNRTGGDAGDGLAAIAVPETARGKIVMMVFGRLNRRRGFACGRVGRHDKTKRMLANQAGQVTVSGWGSQLQ